MNVHFANWWLFISSIFTLLFPMAQPVAPHHFQGATQSKTLWIYCLHVVHNWCRWVDITRCSGSSSCDSIKVTQYNCRFYNGIRNSVHFEFLFCPNIKCINMWNFNLLCTFHQINSCIIILLHQGTFHGYLDKFVEDFFFTASCAEMFVLCICLHQQHNDIKEKQINFQDVVVGISKSLPPRM